jgi:hypothetical protein
LFQAGLPLAPTGRGGHTSQPLPNKYFLFKNQTAMKLKILFAFSKDIPQTQTFIQRKNVARKRVQPFRNDHAAVAPKSDISLVEQKVIIGD